MAILPFSFSAENPQLNSYLYFQFTFTVRQHRQATTRYVQGKYPIRHLPICNSFL